MKDDKQVFQDIFDYAKVKWASYKVKGSFSELIVNRCLPKNRNENLEGHEL